MNKKFLLTKISVILFVLLELLAFPFHDQKVHAFSEQVIQHGAVGDDVIELQARLQYVGYYNGKIDGVFGWQTYWALRNFQYEFGLPIDGLAGTKTKDKLLRATKYNEQFVKEQINRGKKFSHYGGVDLEKQKTPSAKKETTQKQTKKPNTKTEKKPSNNTAKKQSDTQKKASNGGQATPKNNTSGNQNGTGTSAGEGGTATENNNTPAPQNTTNTNGGENTTGKEPTAANVPSGFSQNDIQLMANAVYGEARGEPYVGQVAVAAVILNRVNSATFPNTVSGVIFEPRAFTAVADGQIWLTPNERAKEAVLDAINGWDPTGHALYYFNPDTATSAWIWGRPQIKQIGKHIFCK
ncbi:MULTISPECIES: spore cortex-lytic enzyme [Bacillaceae]|uniref:Spore cortex-lytic enzyme n=1 Tax=Niallia hominis TaxID=3133173 RepID=A0ABV1EWI3_9BACI|nr:MULTISPECIES: spore cortex-lytic enzyme [Bacillaceae]MCF2647603.1 spore cortex-lytic enzyme [Niallia circulans]CAI9388065.1 Spore cortex-lytic enzyme [Bacillus sp. T2.9-1]